jgi:hypothetical protein
MKEEEPVLTPFPTPAMFSTYNNTRKKKKELVPISLPERETADLHLGERGEEKRACQDSLEVAPHGLLVPSSPLQVPVEALQHVEHLANVLHAEGLAAIDRQGLRRADRVLDLPAVEVVLGKIRVVLLGEGHEVNLFEDSDTLDEYLENLLLGLLVERVVAEGNVNT